MVDLITERFDCVLFDLGNTLIAQENPGTPYQDLKVQVLPGVQQLLDELQGKVKLGIVSNTKTITQANLPNVTLGGSTSTDGSHTHTINVNDNTVIVVSGGAVTAMKEGNNNWTAGSTVSNANVISAAGSHSHTITTNSINGNVTQTALDITPKSLSVNTFIYLGF